MVSHVTKSVAGLSQDSKHPSYLTQYINAGQEGQITANTIKPEYYSGYSTYQPQTPS